MQSTRYYCQTLMKLPFFSTDFGIREEISWKSVQREVSYSMRSEVLTHIREEANNHFSQFCERSLKHRTPSHTHTIFVPNGFDSAE